MFSACVQAHIHYLHGDSFGNADAPEIKDMQVVSDAYGITATFTITNKPVNAFWSMFQVRRGVGTWRVWQHGKLGSKRRSAGRQMAASAIPMHAEKPCVRSSRIAAGSLRLRVGQGCLFRTHLLLAVSCTKGHTETPPTTTTHITTTPQVPEVFVTARVFLPSTSVVTFTLGAGLSFTTFVNTVPLTATRSVNRFALIRRLASDRTGLFNARIWDGMARDAMRKILSEDKAMVEQLRYDLLPAEYRWADFWSGEEREDVKW